MPTAIRFQKKQTTLERHLPLLFEKRAQHQEARLENKE